MIDFDVSRYLVKENGTLIDAMNVLTRNRQGIGVICRGHKLQAVLTDGDIRRWMVSSEKLDGEAGAAANHNPRYVYVGEEEKGEALLEKYNCGAVPVLDHDNNILAVIVKEILEYGIENKISVPVVIMAGGKGNRLRPYTDVLPKPLLPIGDKTIIERIIDKFRLNGCDNFSIIVNYKKNLMRTYFEGLENDYQWKLYEENEFLGTAGGLKLLERDISSTFVISNCDILVDCSYADLVEFHKRNDYILSVCCARKEVSIPYGVIDMDEKTRKVTGLREKPVYEVLVNTGLYVAEPCILNMIPKNTFIHITDILNECIRAGEKVGTFIVDDDKWLDMGQFAEMGHMKERLL